jgi:hypothetical protein
MSRPACVKLRYLPQALFSSYEFLRLPEDCSVSLPKLVTVNINEYVIFIELCDSGPVIDIRYPRFVKIGAGKLRLLWMY